MSGGGAGILGKYCSEPGTTLIWRKSRETCCRVSLRPARKSRNALLLLPRESQPRDLVVVAGGDDFDPTKWTSLGGARTWDLIWIYYGNAATIACAECSKVTCLTSLRFVRVGLGFGRDIMAVIPAPWTPGLLAGPAIAICASLYLHSISLF